MDLIHDLRYRYPRPSSPRSSGYPRDRHKFHRWSNAMLTAKPTHWGKLRIIPHVLAMMRYIRKMSRLRKADPRDDLLTALVQAHEASDRMSEDELLSMVVLLLVAGHETTVNLIANGVVALLEHPAELERLRDNPALIKPAVEELLRYDSPVQLATERFAREEVAFEGVTIPRGGLVFAAIGAANRDERQFDHPDSLQLERDPNRHLAFGQGVHFCLGASLARLEGQIAINTLLRRAPDLRLAVPRNALRHRPTLILRGLQSLPVAFSRRRATFLRACDESLGKTQ